MKVLSPLSQVLAQHDQALKLLEDGGVADIVYLDFSKAINELNHQILIRKIRKMGVKGKLLDWIKAWLNGRRYTVIIEGFLST